MGGLISGAVITQALHATKLEYFIDPIFPYLIGITLSLFLILALRQWVHRSGGWLSLGAATIAFLTWLRVKKLSAIETLPAEEKWFLFLLFSFFFCLVFVPKTFRSDVAASKTSTLSLLEFGNAFGFFIGVVLYERFVPEFSNILLLGAFILMGVSVLDFAASKGFKTDEAQKHHARTLDLDDVSKILILAFLTVAVQTVIQRLCVILRSAYPLGAFDLGTTIAPFLCMLIPLTLTKNHPSFNFFSPRVSLSWKGFRLQVPAFALVLLTTFLIAMTIVISTTQKSFMALFFILIGSILYEALALGVVAAIGSKHNSRGIVAIAYGVMAITATVSYWILMHFNAQYLACLAVVGVSAIIVFFGLILMKPSAVES